MQNDDLTIKASLVTTEKDSLTADDEESDQADSDVVRKAAPQKLESKMTIWGDPRGPADSKVKRVTMPITNQTDETAKPAAASSPTESKAAQRPRRATTNR